MYVLCVVSIYHIVYNAPFERDNTRYYEKELIQRQEHSTYVKKTKEEKHVLELEIQRLTSQLQEHRNALTQLLAHTDMEDTEVCLYSSPLHYIISNNTSHPAYVRRLRIIQLSRMPSNLMDFR